MEATVNGVIAVSVVLKGCALAADNYARIPEHDGCFGDVDVGVLGLFDC